MGKETIKHDIPGTYGIIRIIYQATLEIPFAGREIFNSFRFTSQGDERWNPDYDIWIDVNLPHLLLVEMGAELDESIVPFRVDLVTTSQL